MNNKQLELLKDFKDVCDAKGVKTSVIVAEGDPKAKLCEIAEKYHIDTLVMGHR